MSAHPTVDELRAALKLGGVLEAEIRDEKNHIRGLCFENGAIIVNPRPALVEVLLHELIHRTHWRMGETRVRREAKRLLASMTDAEVDEFYRAYHRLARHRKKPVTLPAA